LEWVSSENSFYYPKLEDTDGDGFFNDVEFAAALEWAIRSCKVFHQFEKVIRNISRCLNQVFDLPMGRINKDEFRQCLDTLPQ
jgi:hypothetical protein